MRLIFATNNKHKLSEIVEILGEKYKDFVFNMDDFDINLNPVEDGNTFIENANIKSTALYQVMREKRLLNNGDYIIADDTGLCIDFLDGAPGIHSARFMGEGVSQEEKNIKLLDIMKDVSDEKRKAYFITILSVLEVIDAEKCDYKIHIFDGIVNGYIARTIEKTGGFGYDPIFAVGDPVDIKNGRVMTYSNLGIKEKNKISHRAKAIHNFVLYLEKKHNI